MKIQRPLANTASFVFALCWTYCAVLTAQSTPNPSQVTSLTVGEQNAVLLKQLKEYPNLEVLSIRCVEALQALPDDIGQLRKLRELDMNNGNGCAMNPKLPESIGNLQNLQKLDLYGAQDPRNGPQPKQRHEFPKSMSQLKSLTYLDLGRNGLEEIPDFVKELKNLKEFGFAWNINVRALPPFLGTLPELQTLRLDADGLTDIPVFLRGPKLSLITLGDNCTITTNATRKKALEQRFHGVKLNFEDEYDCPDAK
jgi:Leucine-rich repeat (LRR) protein